MLYQPLEQFEIIFFGSIRNIPITNSLTLVNTSILQNLCGGTYMLVVTDSVNCQRQFGPYTITNPSPLIVTSSLIKLSETSCFKLFSIYSEALSTYSVLFSVYSV